MSLFYLVQNQKFKKAISGGLPGVSVVKNLPSNAGDAGSIPGRGTKIQHAVGQLSPRTSTRERKPTRHS